MSKNRDEDARASRQVGRIAKITIDRWVEPFQLTGPATTIACWSDLLGFGEQLSSAGWNLSSPSAQPLVRRLEQLSVVLRQFSLPHEQVVFVNDGLIRTLSPSTYRSGDNDSANVREWLHRCLVSHCVATRRELELRLPGLRTVICEGELLAYSADLYPGDEFERTSGAGHLLRPLSTQLNTALSKCYLADSQGSKHGLKRGGIYVETGIVNTLLKAHDACLVSDEYLFLTGEPLLTSSAKYRCQSEVFGLETTLWKSHGFSEDRAFWIELGERIPISTKGLTFELREIVALSPIDEFALFWLDAFAGGAHGYLVDSGQPIEPMVLPSTPGHEVLHELIALVNARRGTTGDV